MTKPTFDLDAIIENQERNRGRVNYAKRENEFSPTPGQYAVRILPGGIGITTNPDFFFEPSCVHKMQGVNRAFYECLKMSRNERCPICNFVSKMYDSQVPGNRELAGDMKRYTSYRLNVIVREQSEKGVLMWRIGEKLKTLLVDGIKALRAEELDWDIANPNTGIDFNLTVTVVSSPTQNKTWNNYTGSFKRKPCPLATDPDTVAKLMESRYDLPKQYAPTILTQAEMTEVLMTFLAENNLSELVRLVPQGPAGGARLTRPASVQSIASDMERNERRDPLPSAVVVEEVQEEEPHQESQPEPKPPPPKPVQASPSSISERLKKAVSSITT